MNTRRCELCGELYGTRSGSVMISVPREEVNYHTHDHYNLCEACSLKIYDMIDDLKTSDGKKPEERSALADLVMRQNAEIIKMRMCLRNANDYLISAMKRCPDENDIPKRVTDRIESAIKWIDKSEPYEVD